MKKILLFAGVVLIAAACGPPSNTNVVTNLNTNTAASPPPTMTEAEAIAKEKAVWDAVKNKNYDEFAGYLSADQLEILPDGVMDKAQSVSGVKDFEPSELTFSDWKYVPIDHDAFLLTYSVTMKGKYKGKEFPTETARASSAWVHRGGKWEAIYHQETPVKPPMQPASRPTPATSPTPAGSPQTLTTTDDLVANERMIWDALKRRDYEAFEAVLDEAAVEVESDGVYDKAGIIKGVQTFDASKGTLGDFRPLKFDADAGLVTYTVSVAGPKPVKEMQTTIWVNRGGKWRALFHQGTTAQPAGPSASPSPSAR